MAVRSGRQRKRVLIVEDEILIGIDLAQSLSENGFEVLGPFRSAETALEACEKLQPEAAILDVNLGHGGTSEPVAEKFRARGLPFVFLTGYALSGNRVMDAFPEARRLSKPIDTRRVINALEEI